jgi:hypothetical protein
MINTRIAILAVAAGMMVGSAAPAAPGQVALVEDVTGNPAGVALMDYLETGKTIALGPRDSVVLSYMSSCVRETITGGTVTIGTDQSDAQGAKVVRTKVPCDAGKMVLTSAQTSQFGGRIFRSASPANGSTQDPSPRLTLYGRSPIVELKAPGPLLIERIDQAGERHMIEVRAEHLLHGKFYDFAKSGRNLAAGGVYRISGGGQEIVFKIDSTAKPGGTPIMGRLLRLGTQS